MEIFKNEFRTAAKNHIDDGSENILNLWGEIDNPDKEDVELLEKLKQNNWTIKKGEKYLYQVGIFDGQFFAVHISKDSLHLIDKYHLYDEY